MTNKHPILFKRCQIDYTDPLQGLCTEAEISLAKARELLQLGAVYHQGKRWTTLKGTWCKGELLRIHLEPRRFSLPQVSPQQLVIEQQTDFLIAIKPQGLPTHATLDNAKENLLSFLSRLGELYPAQRLDQMTMGLLLIARTQKFVSRFQSWQNKGLVEKIYLAHTARPVPLGLHLHYTPRNVKKAPRPMWPKRSSDELECRLEVISCEFENGSWASKIRLITGRTHQIRAQMAALNAPLLGDRLYGSAEPPFHPSPLQSIELKIPEENGPPREWKLSECCPQELFGRLL